MTFNRTVGVYQLNIPIINDTILEVTEEFVAVLETTDDDVVLDLPMTTIFIEDTGSKY